MGKNKRQKITKESLLESMNYDFSRDAEWFKRTSKKIDEIKEELAKNFYSEEKKKQKIDFIHKLKNKLKDYTDAKKFELRYKKVRFVERRKLERKLNKVKKEIEAEKDEGKLKELKEQEKSIISDINYVKYYPKTYKYYSLFPNKDADKEELIAKREKMRKKIEFYLNQKNKKHNIEEEDNDEEDISKSIEKEDEEMKNEDEKEEKPKKEKPKKEKIEKVKKEEEEDNDYETEVKRVKKPFKDTFFELDE